MVQYIIFFGMIGMSFILYFIHMRRFKNVILEIDPFTMEYNKTESPIERRLFQTLWHKNYHVVCQYPFGPYRLDMALPVAKIAIEADGKAWHSLPAQKAHDRKRDAYLKSHGWQTLRFSGSKINGDMTWVIRRIKKEIQKKAPIQ